MREIAENETAQALAVVEAYLSAVGPTSEDFWRSFDTYFDEATIWENVGVAKTVGRDEAVRFARAFPVQFDHMRIADLALSGSGNRDLHRTARSFLHARWGNRPHGSCARRL
jgi:limonene-1,2-epoxide hydrolase